jgi:hypothetical protein
MRKSAFAAVGAGQSDSGTHGAHLMTTALDTILGRLLSERATPQLLSSD